MLSTHKFITIYGPTASGKTDLAIRLAEVTRGVIINFDTCQFRNYLPSLTMCPSPSLSIKEYLFNFLSPGDIFTVDDYFNKLQEILME
jgi:tRNA dimethylallyltransferase